MSADARALPWEDGWSTDTAALLGLRCLGRFDMNLGGLDHGQVPRLADDVVKLQSPMLGDGMRLGHARCNMFAEPGDPEVHCQGDNQHDDYPNFLTTAPPMTGSVVRTTFRTVVKASVFVFG